MSSIFNKMEHLENNTAQLFIPNDVFDQCKREEDPGHDDLGESTTFHICVQSNVMPEGVLRHGAHMEEVESRFLFRLTCRCWRDGSVIEALPHGANITRSIEMNCQLTREGFVYEGPVAEEEKRSFRHYANVGDNRVVKNWDLRKAILSTSF